MFGFFKTWQEKQISLVERQMPIIKELSENSIWLKFKIERFSYCLTQSDHATAVRKLRAFYFGFLEGLIRDYFGHLKMTSDERIMYSLKLMCHNYIYSGDIKSDTQISSMTSAYLDIIQDDELSKYRISGIEFCWANMNESKRNRIWQQLTEELEAEYGPSRTMRS